MSPSNSPSTDPDNTSSSLDDDIQDISDKIEKARAEIKKIIFGQDAIIDKTLITLLSGGHVLLIGVPGLAKTLLVETVAKVLGLSSSRIQCTPDLMPADIVGSEVLEEDDKGKRAFRFIEGPVFAQFVMADEINRATPRTQSALLQAMQENIVTVSGKNHVLPKPFHVLATQNPIEQEGTYPLPEAQLDRFLMQIDVSYPGAESEREMMLATTTGTASSVSTIFNKTDLEKAQKLVRLMPVGDKVVDSIVSLVRHCRPGEEGHKLVNDYVDWGPGPRASQALMLACRARALLDGRSAPSPDDIYELSRPVLKHRMALNFKARSDDMTRDQIIETIAKGQG